MKQFFKNKRGFSLVELMVVVAIMGTLATIAIPAYNEYRKSAKKTAYRTDMLGIHKGVLAFGVELDSFCQRESGISDLEKHASFKNIGMESIMNSKLYGPATGGPGKKNLIGFSQSSCKVCNNATCTAPANMVAPQNARADTWGIGLADATTTDDTDCDLNVTAYKIGVYGHIGGTKWTAFSVNENGVVDDQGDNLDNTATGGFEKTCDS